MNRSGKTSVAMLSQISHFQAHHLYAALCGTQLRQAMPDEVSKLHGAPRTGLIVICERSAFIRFCFEKRW